MKIAIVIERYDPNAGGAERSTAQIAGELVKRGHDVTILAGSSPVAPRHELITIKPMLGKERFKSVFHVAKFGGWVRAELAKGGYDTSLSVTTNAPARVMQPRGGTVAEVHERNLAAREPGLGRMIKQFAAMFSPKQWVLKREERAALRDGMVMKIVAVSNYVVRQLELHYHISGEQVTVIPNAAAMPKMTVAERAETRGRVRKELNLADGDVAFLFAAYNPRLKGVDTLLKALAIRKKQGTRAVVLCAGEFGGREKRLAKSLGVMDRIRVLGDRKMPELYVAADVTVLPTYYDPSSKVVIESLMMGVPAITTTFNGASDLIFERTGGVTRGRIISDPGDQRSLAISMQELEDDGVRGKCAKACEGLADRLSMKVHVDALEEVLKAGARGG
jgi:UDP-glucose:(heptosyl)LPS alpha-1,3-glucosyltransferase